MSLLNSCGKFAEETNPGSFIFTIQTGIVQKVSEKVVQVFVKLFVAHGKLHFGTELYDTVWKKI